MNRIATVSGVLLVVLLSGCGGGPPQLMVTPNLYARGGVDPSQYVS